MTTRQAVEIVCLAAVCVASARGFWKGPLKLVGVGLAVVVFLILTLFILHH